MASLELTGQDLDGLLAFSGAFSLYAAVADILDAATFEDNEIAAVVKLPLERRIGLVARLDEIADIMREAARGLDGRLFSMREGMIE